MGTAGNATYRTINNDPGAPPPDPITTSTSIPPVAEPTPTQIVSTVLSVHTGESAATIISTFATTPYLPESSQVLSTWVSWNSDGDAVTGVSTMAVTNYVARPTQLVSTQTSFQKVINTFSSVDTLEATPTIVTYL